MPSTLGYWRIRGLASPIRFMLEYSGEDYREDVYEVGPPPDYSREGWFKVKPTLGLAFPNLPYYIDGDLKMTESLAIINHLSRKHNLDGSTETIRVRGEVLLYRLKDVHRRFTVACYMPESKKLLEEYKADLSNYLKSFEEYLGDNKFFAGDEITKVDFLMYEYLYQITVFEPDCLNAYGKLAKYKERFESLPAIAAYMSSDRHFLRPINNPSAYWH